MDSSILGALFRDPVIKRLTVDRPPSTRAGLPDTVVARVSSVKGDMAVLRWQEGVFNASLDARVVPGETLLLKHKETKQGRPHYRIMARLSSATDDKNLSGREQAEPFLFGLMPDAGGKRGALPALVRFLPQDKQAKDLYDEPEPLLELFLDTDNFGLVLVRFIYHKHDRLECRFIVESEQAGQALQKEAERLVVEAGGASTDEKREPLQWSVGNLRREAIEVMHRGGFSLDKKA